MPTWREKAEQESQQSPQMAKGYHHVTSTKVLRGKRDGTMFETTNGDPQLMVVFENAAGEDIANMFTLSDAADWVLAKFMFHAGLDLDRMEAQGITHRHFADLEFATKQLTNRTCWIEVDSREYNGKKYPVVTFVAERDVPVVDVAKAQQNKAPGTDHTPIPEEDIPF